MKKTIITVVGNDTVGIIAKVCTYLADNNVNILDISQTIVQGYFNMMMIADTAKCEKDGGELAKELELANYVIVPVSATEGDNITTKSENGFQQLKATLPPKERRGLVLIDPPYELKEDYDLVVKAIEEGYKRFATGTYAIWYPVVLRQQTKRIFKGLEATGIRKILKIELAVRPDSDQRGMTASGMVVINPPWQLEQQMKAILPYLTQTLVPEGTGSWTVEWIVPE